MQNRQIILQAQKKEESYYKVLSNPHNASDDEQQFLTIRNQNY